MSTHEYQELNTGRWAEMNPLDCPCRGGWLLSNLDTWHKCPVHHVGRPHPEWDADVDRTPEEWAAEEAKWAARDRDLYRRLYAEAREAARRAGFGGHFKATCVATLHDPDFTRRYLIRPDGSEAEVRPVHWVAAACWVADNADTHHRENEARRRGFSSDLERRLTEAAIEEAEDRYRWSGSYCGSC